MPQLLCLSRAVRRLIWHVKLQIGISALFFLTASAISPLLDTNRQQAVGKDIAAIQQLGGDRLGYAESIAHYLNLTTPLSSYGRTERLPLNQFDLFSGILAIRESLQLDSIAQSDAAQGKVDVSTLRGPLVKSHDFASMLKGRQTGAFSLAQHAPADWFYAHFSSLSRALDLGDYLNQTGGAFYNRFSDAPVDTALKKRILAQLAIKENKEARIFYDAVIAEMAIVSSDFFFGMGTDVSLLFKLRQKTIFESTLKTYRAGFLKATPGAREETLTIEGASVNAITSADNRLRSYFYSSGDFAIVSNSAAAIKRLLSVAQKKESALGSADEFRYMRSVYKADVENEDGFVYFSDAFIRRLVSAEVRISEARRMETAFRLAQAEKLILLHQHAYGKLPRSTEELIAAVAIDADAETQLRGLLKDIRLDGFRAIHANMGSLGFLKPNLETPLNFVTTREAKGYTDFVERYSNFWREYFDPIGIRFKKKSEGIKIDICILPLIENSIYNQVKALLGGAPQKHAITSMPGETLSLAARIGLDTLKILRNSGADLKLLDAVTGNVQIHGLDNYPTIDFDPGFVADELLRGRARPDALIGVLAWSLFHPLRATVEARDAAAADSVIATLRGFSHYRSRWQSFDAYDYDYKGKKITVISLNIARIITFRFHTWTDGRHIHVTSTRDYAEKFLDAEKTTQTIAGNLVALYRPAQINREKPHIVQGNGELIQKGCLAHLGTVKLAAVVFPGEDAATAFAKRYGLKPVCPAGGSYTIKDGRPRHSIFGTHAVSHINMKIAEELFADFFSTQEFKLQFEFTPHGIMSSIETR